MPHELEAPKAVITGHGRVIRAADVKVQVPAPQPQPAPQPKPEDKPK